METLKPHQISGAHKMYKILQKYGGVLLSDALGLGKTRQVIALLALLDFKRCVILVPASVILHWKKEFEIMHGDDEENGMVYVFHRSLHQDTIPSNCGRLIVITTTQTFENCSLHTQKWDVVVVDEATSIKNHATTISLRLKSMTTKYRILVTGTPSQNNLNEIHSLFEFISPDILGSKELFDQQMSIPVTLGTKRNATKEQRENASKIIDILQRMISPLVIRRTIQKPVVKRELVVWCDQEPLEKQLYQSLSSKKANVHELRSILNGTAKAMSFHISGKQKKLQEMIDQIVLKRLETVAVFVQRIDLLKWIVAFLKSNNITFGIICGSVSAKKREDIIEGFNCEKLQVLVATTRSSATGINLTNCAHLIIAEADWNASIDDQAAARSFRMSSSVNTTIYRLITNDTIEEKIYDVQLQKTTANQAFLKHITESVSAINESSVVVDWPLWTPGKVSSHDKIVAKLALDHNEYIQFCKQYDSQKLQYKKHTLKRTKRNAFRTKKLLQKFIRENCDVSTSSIVHFHRVLFEKHRINIEPHAYRKILYKIAVMDKQTQFWKLKS
jgi:SNF2 family DNA or RNA helicase